MNLGQSKQNSTASTATGPASLRPATERAGDGKTTTRPAPPWSELTPSECVLLVGERIAPPAEAPTPANQWQGLRFRIQAELRFAHGELGCIVVGMCFALCALSSVPFYRYGLGGLGIATIVFGSVYWRSRRRATSLAQVLAPGMVFLLDGRQAVDRDKLVTSLIAVALLANERAGALRFESPNEGDAESRGQPETPAPERVTLLAAPTGETARWPRTSLEARLAPDAPTPVSTLVSDWLAAESADPFLRAWKMIGICAELRGLAALANEVSRTRAAEPDATALSDPISGGLLPAWSWVGDSLRERAELWEALRTHIGWGLQARRRDSSNMTREPDPWDLEAAEDRPTPPSREGTVLGLRAALLLGVISTLGVLWAAHAWADSSLIRGLMAAGYVSLLLMCAAGKQPGAQDTSRDWIRRCAVGGFLGSLIALLILALCKSNDGIFLESIGIPLALAGALIWWLWVVLTRRAAGRIQATLSEIDSVAPASAAVSSGAEASLINAVGVTPIANSSKEFEAGKMAKESTTGRAGSWPAERGRTEVRPLAGDDLPPASEAVLEVLERDQRRPAAVRRARWVGLASLAGGLVLFSLIVLVAGILAHFQWEGEAGRETGVICLFGLIVVGFGSFVTLVLVMAFAPFAEKAVWVGFVRTMNSAWLQPWVVLALTGFWRVVALIAIPLLCADFKNPWRAIPTLAGYGVLASSAWIARRSLQRLDRDLPVPPPLRLLMLRVFGSPSFSDLVSLLGPWQRLGVIDCLDGPGTTGMKLEDIANLLRGHVDDSLAKKSDEVERRFRTQSMRPSLELDYQRFSIQCTGATWKPAIGRMLARADVVVMDLSSLSQENQGCAYELGRLLDEVPLGRVILLVNDSTDLECLRQILDAAWQRIAPGSPNRIPASSLDAPGGLASPVWRILQVGGLSARAESESQFEWSRRLRHRLDPVRLASCLQASALPPRIAPPSGSADPQAAPYPWASAPLRPRAGRFLLAAWLAGLALSIAFSAWSIWRHNGAGSEPGSETEPNSAKASAAIHSLK